MAAKKKAQAKKKPVAKKAAAEKTAPVKKIAVAARAALAPLEDRIVIEVAKSETRTAGGLYIPETASNQPNRGTVIATGKGRRTKKGVVLPLDVRVGDQVLYGEYSGTKLSVDGREVLILRESDLLGVLE